MEEAIGFATLTAGGATDCYSSQSCASGSFESVSSSAIVSRRLSCSRQRSWRPKPVEVLVARQSKWPPVEVEETITNSRAGTVTAQAPGEALTRARRAGQSSCRFAKATGSPPASVMLRLEDSAQQSAARSLRARSGSRGKAERERVCLTAERAAQRVRPDAASGRRARSSRPIFSTRSRVAAKPAAPAVGRRSDQESRARAAIGVAERRAREDGPQVAVRRHRRRGHDRGRRMDDAFAPGPACATGDRHSGSQPASTSAPRWTRSTRRKIAYRPAGTHHRRLPPRPERLRVTVHRVAPYVLDYRGAEPHRGDRGCASRTSTLAATLLPGTSADVEVILDVEGERCCVFRPRALLEGGKSPGARRRICWPSARSTTGLRNWDFTRNRLRCGGGRSGGDLARPGRSRGRAPRPIAVDVTALEAGLLSGVRRDR